MDNIKIAVIGIGTIGSCHAKNIFDGKINNAVLSAVCDNDPERLEWAKAAFPGIPVYSTHRELLNDATADAVLIATPHYFHCPIAADAFAAGLHVLSEKPIGVYTKEAYALHETANKSGKIFAIMFNQRTDSLYKTLRRLIRENKIGAPVRLDWTVTNWYRTQEYYNSSFWRATWKGEGGGVLLNQAVHNLDLWQWLFGMPKSITSFCRFGHRHDIEVEDEVVLYADYKALGDSPAPCAVFTTSTGEFPGTNRLEIAGTGGKIVAENGKIFLFENNKDRTGGEFTEVAFDNPDAPAGHNVIIQNFVNAVLFDEELISPGTDGVNSLEIINAALLSSWEGRSVDIPVDSGLYYQRLSEKIAASSFNKQAAKKSPDGKYSTRWDIHW